MSRDTQCIILVLFAQQFVGNAVTELSRDSFPIQICRFQSLLNTKTNSNRIKLDGLASCFLSPVLHFYECKSKQKGHFFNVPNECDLLERIKKKVELIKGYR